jgi:RNA polymerase sigma factor (TIGR02999 family)
MDPGEITLLLGELRDGNRQAESRLITLLYPDLRKIARRLMGRENPGHTLQTTALLHEAYIRMTSGASVDWKDRAHFLGMAAHLMRNILVDHARSKRAQRRGGVIARKISLDSIDLANDEKCDELLAIHEALSQLSEADDRAARVLEAHFFGGLGMEEISVWLDISTRTAKRDLSFAKAWVYQRLSSTARP